MEFEVAPIEDKTWVGHVRREESKFTSSYSDTVTDLERQVAHLRGKHVIVRVDVLPGAFRLDGRLRADAKAMSPAVEVLFETAKHGDMRFRCDRFVRGVATANRGGQSVRKMTEDWQHNLRAIAKTMENLRAIDRYGSMRDEQYTGFKALPAGRAMPASHMTADEAWSIIGSYQSRPIAEFRARHDEGELTRAYRSAQAANHPDRRGGDRALWDQVEQAARVLGVTA